VLNHLTATSNSKFSGHSKYLCGAIFTPQTAEAVEALVKLAEDCFAESACAKLESLWLESLSWWPENMCPMMQVKACFMNHKVG
jgi:hypothetical protein